MHLWYVLNLPPKFKMSAGNVTIPYNCTGRCTFIYLLIMDVLLGVANQNLASWRFLL